MPACARGFPIYCRSSPARSTGTRSSNNMTKWSNMPLPCNRAPPIRKRSCSGRSEEHTSELQSLMRNSYAVFCLKKKHHTQRVAITQLDHHVYTMSTHTSTKTYTNHTLYT